MKNKEPHWIETFEKNIIDVIHVHSNFISSFKLFIITPILGASLLYGFFPIIVHFKNLLFKKM